MRAADRIAIQESNKVYKKVGRRYIPINDPSAYEGLRKGWWLVKVGDGCTSIRSCLHPYRAEIDAAIKDRADDLVEIIRKACEAKPSSKKISQECQKDWKLFLEKHGEDMLFIEYPSMRDIAEKILELVNE